MKILDQIQSKLCNSVFIVLKDKNIPFCIDNSTLLAAYGHTIGLSLKEDSNVHLSVDSRYYDQLKNGLKSLSFKYKFYMMVDRSERDWIPSNYYAFAVLSSFQKRETSFKIIINIKWKNNNKIRWVEKRSCKEVSSKYFEKYLEMKFKLNNISNGIKLPIPKHTEEYLSKRYGSNWQEYKADWIQSIDDECLISNDLIKKVNRKTVIQSDVLKKIKLQNKNYHQKMKDMLLNTIDILNDNNIKYWIEAGTLLGIIRDGDLIPWDYDADIGINAESINDIMKLKMKFFPRYLIKKKFIETGWLPGNVRVIKVKTTWEKIKQLNFHLDLFCLYRVENNYRWSDSNALKHVNRKFYDKLDIIDWEGRKIYIPSNVEEYLTLRYGDWKSPKKNYNAGTQDGAIAEKGF